MSISEETIIEKKVHQAIELQQIIALELEIVGQEYDTTHEIDPAKLKESIDRLVRFTEATASVLREIRLESRNLVLK